MCPHPQISFLHFEEVELVKQNPVVITGQFGLADQERKTPLCDACSVRTASLDHSGALPSSVSFPQPWPVWDISRVSAPSPLEDAIANIAA